MPSSMNSSYLSVPAGDIDEIVVTINRPVLSAEEQQEKQLAESVAVVESAAKEMQRYMQAQELVPVLRAACRLFGELRIRTLDPHNYYELYIVVFDATHDVLYHYLVEEHTLRGQSLEKLYDVVQSAGAIVPRLYLLILVGAVYMDYGCCDADYDVSAARRLEIFGDLLEMCTGVQHPTRGLFLRHFLLTVVKSRLPDDSGPNPSSMPRHSTNQNNNNNNNNTTRGNSNIHTRDICDLGSDQAAEHDAMNDGAATDTPTPAPHSSWALRTAGLLVRNLHEMTWLWIRVEIGRGASSYPAFLSPSSSRANSPSNHHHNDNHNHHNATDSGASPMQSAARNTAVAAASSSTTTTTTTRRVMPVHGLPRARRERTELCVLVGMNVVRIAELDGLQAQDYQQFILPQLLDVITRYQDGMAQQYLYETIVYVFPDEFHLITLQPLLETLFRLADVVHVAAVMRVLMDRLGRFVLSLRDGVAEWTVPVRETGEVVVDALVDIMLATLDRVTIASRSHMRPVGMGVYGIGRAGARSHTQTRRVGQSRHATSSSATAGSAASPSSLARSSSHRPRAGMALSTFIDVAQTVLGLIGRLDAVASTRQEHCITLLHSVYAALRRRSDEEDSGGGGGADGRSARPPHTDHVDVAPTTPPAPHACAAANAIHVTRGHADVRWAAVSARASEASPRSTPSHEARLRRMMTSMDRSNRAVVAALVRLLSDILGAGADVAWLLAHPHFRALTQALPCRERRCMARRVSEAILTGGGDACAASDAANGPVSHLFDLLTPLLHHPSSGACGAPHDDNNNSAAARECVSDCVVFCRVLHALRRRNSRALLSLDTLVDLHRRCVGLRPLLDATSAAPAWVTIVRHVYPTLVELFLAAAVADEDAPPPSSCAALAREERRRRSRRRRRGVRHAVSEESSAAATRTPSPHPATPPSAGDGKREARSLAHTSAAEPNRLFARPDTDTDTTTTTTAIESDNALASKSTAPADAAVGGTDAMPPTAAVRPIGSPEPPHVALSGGGSAAAVDSAPAAAACVDECAGAVFDSVVIHATTAPVCAGQTAGLSRVWEQMYRDSGDGALQVLTPVAPRVAFYLYLRAAEAADGCAGGAMRDTLYTAALTLYEDYAAPREEQVEMLSAMVNSLLRLTAVTGEAYDGLASRVCQCASSLLRRADQSRMMARCAYLFTHPVMTAAAGCVCVCVRAESVPPKEEEPPNGAARALERIERCLMRARTLAELVPQKERFALYVELLQVFVHFSTAAAHRVVSVERVNDLLGEIGAVSGGARPAQYTAEQRALENTVAYIRKQREAEMAGGGGVETGIAAVAPGGNSSAFFQLDYTTSQACFPTA